MMSKWCPNDGQMIPKWYPNDVQMIRKQPNDVQMVSKWCPNDVRDDSACTACSNHVGSILHCLCCICLRFDFESLLLRFGIVVDTCSTWQVSILLRTSYEDGLWFMSKTTTCLIRFGKHVGIICSNILDSFVQRIFDVDFASSLSSTLVSFGEPFGRRRRKQTSEARLIVTASTFCVYLDQSWAHKCPA